MHPGTVHLSDPFFPVVASEDAARVETSAGEALVVVMRDLIEDGKIKVFRHLGRHACFVEDVVAVGVAKKRKPALIQPSEHLLSKRICFYSDASVDPDRVAVFGKYAVRVHLEPFSRKPRMGVAWATLLNRPLGRREVSPFGKTDVVDAGTNGCFSTS